MVALARLRFVGRHSSAHTSVSAMSGFWWASGSVTHLRSAGAAWLPRCAV